MFPAPRTRRAFLTRTVQSALALACAPAPAAEPPSPGSFSFVLLGDLHFDRLEHHDTAWLEQHKHGDLGQIRNYSRITAELMPRLFASVRASLQAEAAPAFVLQVGDVVEGLCGTEELSRRQNQEAVAMLQEAALPVPFLFTKGNHDVTGDGAPAAFAGIFHPFLDAQRRLLEPAAEPLQAARYSLSRGNARFCFFDAYDAESLPWLEAELARRTEEHCFVAIHPPVVPYGARTNWILFNGEKQRPAREKLLALLGTQRAYVLGGHIHRFSVLTRETRPGRFVQLAVSSVVNSAATEPRTVLNGLEAYTPEQLRTEPNFSPETAELRRAICEAERPFLRSFQYADLPGHTVIRVEGARVTAEVYAGVSRQLWQRVELSGLMGG